MNRYIIIAYDDSAKERVVRTAEMVDNKLVDKVRLLIASAEGLMAYWRIKLNHKMNHRLITKLLTRLIIEHE